MSTLGHGPNLAVDEEFGNHCVDWLDLVRKCKWGKPDRNPVWKLAELPALGQYEGLYWGFRSPRLPHPFTLGCLATGRPVQDMACSAGPIPIRTLTFPAPQGPTDATIAPVAFATLAMFDFHVVIMH